MYCTNIVSCTQELTYEPKSEIGRRNVVCIKFLSGNYRKVVNGEKKIPSIDSLSLMLVGSAYYALGKFEQALSAYQKAGIELRKKIGNSPEVALSCAKLFNNMAGESNLCVTFAALYSLCSILNTHGFHSLLL